MLDHCKAWITSTPKSKSSSCLDFKCDPSFGQIDTCDQQAKPLVYSNNSQKLRDGFELSQNDSGSDFYHERWLVSTIYVLHFGNQTWMQENKCISIGIHLCFFAFVKKMSFLFFGISGRAVVFSGDFGFGSQISSGLGKNCCDALVQW